MPISKRAFIESIRASIGGIRAYFPRKGAFDRCIRASVAGIRAFVACIGAWITRMGA